MDGQYIYLVFSATPYRIGKLIRQFTGEAYNHVSIALDQDLTEMYSFARRYYRTPFLGGFVKESFSRYHVNGNHTDIRICKLPVTLEQYRSLETLLTNMFEKREDYLYNHLSAAIAILRRPVKVRDSYTCVEFCVRVLHSLNVDVDPNRYYTVGDIEQLLRPYTIYTGPLPHADEFDAEYYAKKPVPHPTAATVSAIMKLFQRI